MIDRHDWVIAPNPGFTGQPRQLEVLCHDRTPFLTIRCGCGNQLHIHEPQVAAHAGHEIASKCYGCNADLVFPPGFFHRAFKQMREEGWIR